MLSIGIQFVLVKYIIVSKTTAKNYNMITIKSTYGKGGVGSRGIGGRRSNTLDQYVSSAMSKVSKKPRKKQSDEKEETLNECTVPCKNMFEYLSDSESDEEEIRRDINEGPKPCKVANIQQGNTWLNVAKKWDVVAEPPKLVRSENVSIDEDVMYALFSSMKAYLHTVSNLFSKEGKGLRSQDFQQDDPMQTIWRDFYLNREVSIYMHITENLNQGKDISYVVETIPKSALTDIEDMISSFIKPKDEAPEAREEPKAPEVNSNIESSLWGDMVEEDE